MLYECHLPNGIGCRPPFVDEQNARCMAEVKRVALCHNRETSSTRRVAATLATQYCALRVAGQNKKQTALVTLFAVLIM
jgi:hypothetical protein